MRIVYNLCMLNASQYIDMHCHLDFSPDALALARAGKEKGLAFLSMTVDPRDFLNGAKELQGESNVEVGAGLHPRWLADKKCSSQETDTLCTLIREFSLVGEIGLDFSGPYAHAREEQICALERICKTCATYGGKLLSIHALRSASYSLDIIESCKAHESCTCIMHWFSGSNEELWRAINLGCWFSVNERMLATKRGAEYAKLIPAGHLLLESDLPSQAGEHLSAEQLFTSFERTVEQLARIRKIPDLAVLREQILANSLRAIPS